MVKSKREVKFNGKVFIDTNSLIHLYFKSKAYLIIAKEMRLVLLDADSPLRMTDIIQLTQKKLVEDGYGTTSVSNIKYVFYQMVKYGLIVPVKVFLSNRYLYLLAEALPRFKAQLKIGAKEEEFLQELEMLSRQARVELKKKKAEQVTKTVPQSMSKPQQSLDMSEPKPQSISTPHQTVPIHDSVPKPNITPQQSIPKPPVSQPVHDIVDTAKPQQPQKIVVNGIELPRPLRPDEELVPPPERLSFDPGCKPIAVVRRKDDPCFICVVCDGGRMGNCGRDQYCEEEMRKQREEMQKQEKKKKKLGFFKW